MSRALASGTWCERQDPSVRWPSISFGPVQPFGVRSTIIGQAGRSVSRPASASSAACTLISAILSRAVSSTSAKRRWVSSGSSSSKPPVKRSGSCP